MLWGAEPVVLESIEVSAQTSAVINDIDTREVKSADLAETLHKQVPSINMIRRSGIANDIVLRGQKRDNINVTIDDAKIYGACPNRMDPASSHILTSNINRVEVVEGPFDVENFGSLSGVVKVETKEPKKGFHGDLYLNAGSFGYQKIGATLSAAGDKAKLLITASTEEGDQYKDGNGNTLAEQLEIANTVTMDGMNPEFQDRYKEMKAFEKQTFMAKTFLQLTKNQDMELSYTLNRSDNILYPNSKMDALYDDSDIINFKYTFNDLGSLSKKLQLKAYNSQVEHPMSTKYRLLSDSNNTDSVEDSANETISQLTTDTTGVKIINETKLNKALLVTGLDFSTRNWDGSYIGYGSKAGITGRTSINDVDTANSALFLKYKRKMDNVTLKMDARINDTTITTADTTYAKRDFSSVDTNIFASYETDKKTKYFIGLGQASRVPDARELYFTSSMNVMSGTPTLDQVTNSELDLGIEKKYTDAMVKVKLFYSKLDNYIYFNQGNTMTMNVMGTPKTLAYNSFENIDAAIYGLELKGNYDLGTTLSLDFGAAYQKGKKSEAMTSTNVNMITSTTTITAQTDKDLADIVPLKANIALIYEPSKSMYAKAELVAATAWEDYDSDNGEQKLPGYGIINLKAQKTFAKKYEITAGVDNVMDKTYAVSNTYADLTLLSDGTSSEVMLLNEPGRYIYTNFKYKF